uniref:Protein tipE n=1 Tax=Timema cristinae TaxID=61476 RepID=A0A7R9D6L4_TIMCR|nr:unnamed protein product [Timema cristinae]
MGGEGGGGGDCEEEEEEEEVEPLVREPTFLEKAKFYTSLCLGTTAILSVFAFLFLIPFVVDPAITTILADYEPEAITCLAISHSYVEGLKNCSWSSCREGCTTAQTRCHQILVNYSKILFSDWEDRSVDSVEWDFNETRFFINTEGCGYPPRVNCSEFAKQYGYTNVMKPFPCYYSRTYPEMVVARYSWDSNLKHLVLSLIVPNALFGISIGVLCYWYCPGCNRACHKNTYVENFPTKHDDNDDDDYFEEEEY